MIAKKVSFGFALFTLLVCSVLAVPPAYAQTAATAVSDGWHTVRPGESLWEIAARYLGSETEWRTIHALNPDIENPNRITPGQRVRVEVAPGYSGDVAKVVKISRRVEEQLTPHPWTASSVENLLNPRDGMRTFEASSSEILFADDSRLVMSEDSLVFIGRGGQVDQRARRDEIEIVMGQGDFDGSVEARTREFVVGGSRIKPTEGDVIQTRLRRFDSGNSQVMVYEGESAVESAGASQKVERGMGTQMKDGERPAPPERLLLAPEPKAPEAASEWRVGNPPFGWSPVEGAAGYVLEVCGDKECAKLVAKYGDIEQAEYRAASLQAGSLFWRVTAVSPSGLDGYPSATTQFAILSIGPDTTGPVIETAFTGKQIERHGVRYLGVGARIHVQAEDLESGIERVWAELDGERVGLPRGEGPWELGPHEVVIKARDLAGNVSSSEILAFVYDTVGPQIHWGLESGGLYHSFIGDEEPVARPEGQRGRKAPKLKWSRDHQSWQEVGPESQRVQRSEAPRFFLRSAGRRTAVYGAEYVFLELKRGKGVGVAANDGLVGTEWLNFRVEESGSGRDRDPRLIVEAIDWLGNRSSVSWPLGRGRRARPR